MKADAVVRARIPADVRDQAYAALEKIGLNASDLIRLTFMRVAESGRLPFDLSIPNDVTRNAIAELNEGKGKKFASAAELFDDLGL